MLNHILGRARDSGVRLLAEFVSNERNRMMYVTYKFAGFREIESRAASRFWSMQRLLFLRYRITLL